MILCPFPPVLLPSPHPLDQISLHHVQDSELRNDEDVYCAELTDRFRVAAFVFFSSMPFFGQ